MPIQSKGVTQQIPNFAIILKDQYVKRRSHSAHVLIRVEQKIDLFGDFSRTLNELRRTRALRCQPFAVNVAMGWASMGPAFRSMSRWCAVLVQNVADLFGKLLSTVGFAQQVDASFQTPIVNDRMFSIPGRK